MHVHYSELSDRFVQHFFENSTKAESIEPFFYENVSMQFNGEEFDKKEAVLHKLHTILPMQPTSKSGYVSQPFKNGVLITLTIVHKDLEMVNNKYIVTFILQEVDLKIHKYNITSLIVLDYKK